ncbi:RrF2 family transcriptional regulator [Pengzhenrongella frigida]|uniref:Rrf2 family transcriptional regulator n=1 Tax=Pengzhenrongella frigida TaxID=1259133 RepID=A0A4Q5N431_9MICO|nr:Rrf2 family transcriptional regulator [Cellulomonas sp. HLT2-17]RYV53012.1 Rrf2 family transcriptional regulator [Cellulomonas sp. HLT2-17]
MRINAFSDVSLRVLILLAAAPGGADVMTSKAISVQVGTPYHHVTKIVARLRELDLIEVTRGRSGGVRISPAGRQVTVGWVLRTFERRTDVADCETPAGNCPLLDGCGLRGALGRARSAFYSELDDVVVASLAHQPRLASTPLTLGSPAIPVA